MTNRCRIYARVSSDRQRKDNTVANQLGPAVERQIKAYGLDLNGIYTDDGKSASTGKLHLRGDFLRACADAEKHEYDVLWVADLDRITRSNDWGELGQIFGPLQKSGIKLAGPHLAPMALGDSMSMMQIIMRIIVAYEDNQKRKERFQIGKREAALRGCHAQGTIPYGLTWRTGARDNSGWGIDEVKAMYVREIFRRAVASLSGDAIAKDMEERGIPGPRGGRWDQAVIRILRSPVYRGVHYWNDVIIPVPRIVDDETWYAAQAALGQSKKQGIGKPLGLYLCHRLAVCSLCGATMYMKHGEGAKGATVRQYQCLNRSHRRLPGTPRCTLPVFKQETTDELIWACVADFFSQPAEVILSALRGKREEQDQEAQAWSSDAEKLTSQLADLAKREKAILGMLMQGLIEEEAAKEQITTNAARRAHLQAQLKTAQDALEGTNSTVSAARQLEELVGQLKTVARKADAKQRRDLLRLLVVRGGITFDMFGASVRLVFEPGATEKPDLGHVSAPAVTLRVVA